MRNLCNHVGTLVALCHVGLAGVAASPARAAAQSSTTPPPANVQQISRARDGQADFDFEIGTWKTHLRRLIEPLTGSTTWAEYDGTTVVRKVWNGRANLVELDVDGPAGHIEALSLRLYNPQSRQWSLNFANSAAGHGDADDRRVPERARRVLRPGNPERPRDPRALPHPARLARHDPLRAVVLGRRRQDVELNWVAVDTRVKEPLVRP